VADGNLFSPLPENLPTEIFETLLATPHLRLERIISHGQATPAGEWYDQETHEWVVLLRGAACLIFDGQPEIVVLRPGDYVHLPAHRRHRVAWTDLERPTVWLALHYK
jgi:cupin 2 domain-containing protein